MDANRVLLHNKYVKVINAFSERQNIDLRKAMDVFYKSRTYEDMRFGVSDMHCRSELYLAEELIMENNSEGTVNIENL